MVTKIQKRCLKNQNQCEPKIVCGLISTIKGYFKEIKHYYFVLSEILYVLIYMNTVCPYSLLNRD